MMTRAEQIRRRRQINRRIREVVAARRSLLAQEPPAEPVTPPDTA